jgi:acylphosphatase
MNRQTCHFSGRVQGVGFRYTVRNVSQQYDVSGYVRNLPDGRVELVMEGPDQEMDHLLHDLRQRMEGFIGSTRIEKSPATGEFAAFCIRH